MSKAAANPKLTYDVVVEVLPGYTLGILDANEMLAVDEYLRRHQDLLSQLQRTDEMVAHLARTAPTVTPAPHVKEALMARVYSALSQEPTIELQPASSQPVSSQPVSSQPTSSQPAVTRPALGSAYTLPRSETASPMSWLDQLRYELGGGLTWPTSTALAVLACLMLALLSVQMWRNQRIAFSRLSEAQQNIEILGSQNTAILSANSALQEQLSERNEQIARFATAMRSIALEGTEFAPQASGAFYTGRTSGVLLLNGLAPLPSDQTYQLWLIPADGDPISAGLVQVTADGTTSSEIMTEDQPQDFAAVGLSIEPAGGSPQPTGPIVLLGTVSS